MIAAPCFFAILVSASVLGPGMVSASLKKRWSSIWQKYCEANSSCVQMIFAPRFAACSTSRICFTRFASTSAEQDICVSPTGTTLDKGLDRLAMVVVSSDRERQDESL